MNKVYASVLIGILILSVFGSFRAIQPSPWVAPKGADTIINPFKGNLSMLNEGKKIYTQLCVVCHGEKGKGDGIAATGLTPRPADHSAHNVQAQTDGAIFWKMSTGRPPMAGYEKLLTPKQRWALVNYIRSLKK